MMSLTTRQKIRIASALSRSMRSARRAVGASSDIVNVRRNGINWRLDLREGIDLSIYLLGAFEWRTVRAYSRLVAPGDVVLDIGANIGAHTLQLARLVAPTGRVYAFEPTAYAYRKLLDNVAVNPHLAAGIAPEQAMLVSTDASALEPEIWASWPLVGSEHRHVQHQGTLKSTDGARAVTLDQFLTESGIRKVDFVKLDVDGHECDVLDGWTTLARYRPKMIMELAPYEEGGRTLSALLARVSAAGYRFFDLRHGPRLGPRTGRSLDTESLARIRRGASINVLAIPADR